MHDQIKNFFMSVLPARGHVRIAVLRTTPDQRKRVHTVALKSVARSPIEITRELLSDGNDQPEDTLQIVRIAPISYMQFSRIRAKKQVVS